MEIRGKNLTGKALALILSLFIKVSLLPATETVYADDQTGGQQPASLDLRDAEGADEAMPSIDTTVTGSSHGSVMLDLTQEALTEAGYQGGDIIRVKLAEDNELVVPLLSGRSGIGFHKAALQMSSRGVSLRISGGSFEESSTGRLLR